MNIHLKVKIHGLADEAKYIRRLERNIAKRIAKRNINKGTVLKKGDNPAWQSLHGHRRMEVRRESRCSHLAYGFLRNTPYKVMENKCWEKPDWKKVEEIAIRFSPEDKRVVAQRFSEWKEIIAE